MTEIKAALKEGLPTRKVMGGTCLNGMLGYTHARYLVPVPGLFADHWCCKNDSLHLNSASGFSKK